MKKVQITLEHLNKFYPIIKEKVTKDLENSKIFDNDSLNEKQKEIIISYNIQQNTNSRMKNIEQFKKELKQLKIIKDEG